MKNCRVIDNEICFNSKEIFNIYESEHNHRIAAALNQHLTISPPGAQLTQACHRLSLQLSASLSLSISFRRLFHTRYSLHKQVYSHRVSKAVEYMLCDVLLLADPVLHLSESILSASAYCRLTDCVLKQIECSTEPELQAARDLIYRIRTRRLYRLVEEAIIPTQLAGMADVTVSDILDCAPPATGDGVVQPCDVHVQNLRMSYAMKDKNPVDHVRFFDKSDVNVSYRIPKSKVSHVMPELFSETVLRVYIKDIEEQQPSKPKFESLKAATTEWLRQHGCESPRHQTNRIWSAQPQAELPTQKPPQKQAPTLRSHLSTTRHSEHSRGAGRTRGSSRGRPRCSFSPSASRSSAHQRWRGDARPTFAG